MKNINIIRGFNDILPFDSYKWQFLESKIRLVLNRYYYSEIRLPIIEKSELFHRSIGKNSDISLKETYDLNDRNGDNITLRPEGTAGCVRMVIENNLITRGQIQKLWYLGPMFRYERPQKGRYRQFHQLGVEAFGFDNIAIDLEILTIIWNIFKELKISEYMTLELNNLGSTLNRKKYIQKFVEYLKPYHSELDKDSILRFEKNPLRILDSKIQKTQKILINAPKIIDFIDQNILIRFKKICKYLDVLDIKYRINNNLVRGLDYYNDLVFEWTTDKLGSQNAICAGGRYDTLTENLGGQKTSAIGFAIGLERLLLLIEDLNKLPKEDKTCDIFFIIDSNILDQSLIIVENIRQKLPKLKINMDFKFISFKSQFKKANKSQAKIAIIIGQNELDKNFVNIKYLKEDKKQEEIFIKDLINFLKITI